MVASPTIGAVGAGPRMRGGIWTDGIAAGGAPDVLGGTGVLTPVGFAIPPAIPEIVASWSFIPSIQPNLAASSRFL